MFCKRSIASIKVHPPTVQGSALVPE